MVRACKSAIVSPAFAMVVSCPAKTAFSAAGGSGCGAVCDVSSRDSALAVEMATISLAALARGRRLTAEECRSGMRRIEGGRSRERHKRARWFVGDRADRATTNSRTAFPTGTRRYDLPRPATPLWKLAFVESLELRSAMRSEKKSQHSTCQFRLRGFGKGGFAVNREHFPRSRSLRWIRIDHADVCFCPRQRNVDYRRQHATVGWVLPERIMRKGLCEENSDCTQGSPAVFRLLQRLAWSTRLYAKSRGRRRM